MKATVHQRVKNKKGLRINGKIFMLNCFEVKHVKKEPFFADILQSKEAKKDRSTVLDAKTTKKTGKIGN